MRALKGVVVALALAIAAPAGAVGSLADLTVHDRTEGRRLQVYWHQGRAYVVGKPGNEYQVSLRSRQGDDVLAVVSVDGVNVLTGETAAPYQSGYLLEARGGYDILGWRKSTAETAAFYFTALSDSYAGRTGRPENVGVIGVAVFRKKQVQPPPPAVRPFPRSESHSGLYSYERERSIAGRRDLDMSDNAMAQGKAAEAPLGTGHGRRETSHVTYVDFERASNSPAEVISLYYDSYRNLVARGVIREPAPRPLPYPRPFPGFVPDPV
jgi:hypothetical protein